MSQQIVAGEGSGTLALIGGGDYEQSERVDRVLLEVAGGPDTSVVFLPTAHTSRRVGDKFANYYASLGARNVRVVPVYESSDAHSESYAGTVREAGLIFIGWGSDIRLLQIIANTPIQTAIEAAFQRGAVVVGTSAGARVAGELVISPANGPVGLRGGFQSELRQPDNDTAMDEKTVLQIWPGFNWLPGIGVEAHLAEWNRYGHLLALGALRPDLTWIGFDERTGLIVEPGGQARVIGPGNMVVAKRNPQIQATAPTEGKALEARGLRFDVLSEGSLTSLKELRNVQY